MCAEDAEGVEIVRSLIGAEREEDFDGDCDRFEVRDGVVRWALKLAAESARGALVVRSLCPAFVGEMGLSNDLVATGGHVVFLEADGFVMLSSSMLECASGALLRVAIPGIAMPPFPKTGCGVFVLGCMNCVGSWASACGACLLRRMPFPGAPIKVAREVDWARSATDLRELFWSGLYTWFRSINRRRGVSSLPVAEVPPKLRSVEDGVPCPVPR